MRAESFFQLASLAIASLVLVSGCSSVAGTAIQTGLQTYPASTGPIRIFTRGDYPEGTEIGIVEVHGTADDATIDVLFPELVGGAAKIGADALLIEDTVSEARTLTSVQYDRVTYGCPYRGVCSGTQTYPIANEVPFLSMRGRAFRLGAAPATPAPPTPPPAQGIELQ